MSWVILPALAAGSAYAAYTSILSIQNVRTYEAPTEQAAKVSTVAADQLKNTRTTEAAGALAAALSLVSAITFAIYPDELPSAHLGFAALNVGALAFASDHVSRFWTGKLKVPAPGLQKYNDAITQMEILTRTLMFLALGWAADFGLAVAGVVAKNV